MYVSRGYLKLEHILKTFKIDVNDKICADFGSSTGGFVQCLLENGAKKVYAIEKGYGVLDWKLRQDKRVVVLERKNLFHVELPELVDIVSVDVGWTKQILVIKKAIMLLRQGGIILSLIKPHYESETRFLRGGKVVDQMVDKIVDKVVDEIKKVEGIKINGIVESPIRGVKGGNREFLLFAFKI